MSIRRRLVLLVALILFAGTALIGRGLLNTFRQSYSELLESLMRDFAANLSAQIEMSGGLAKGPAHLQNVFERFRSKIDPTSSFEVYVTDARGTVIYSSRDRAEIGKDYSRWNDVYLTLRGRYGARSTRTNPADPRTSVYHVAAPIQEGKRIEGVVTLIKSEHSLTPFLNRTFMKALPIGLIGLVAIALFTAFVMIWVTQPIHLLRDYALSISEGERSIPPRVSAKELAELLSAFEKMRMTLEGRKVIESFVQGLVHELKSPLTAIRASAELSLEAGVPAERRDRFLGSVLNEARRVQVLLDELLRLARLEGQMELQCRAPVALGQAVHSVVTAVSGIAELKQVQIEVSGDPEVRVEGDALLLEQAIRNLLVNAIEFSPQGGRIQISIGITDGAARLRVRDQGPGIPDYAHERIFEKFYSLERPDTGTRSTGLGLNFVREVMKLHQGTVSLSGEAGRGATFELRLPGAMVS